MKQQTQTHLDLETIRRQIDMLDEQLHDLLMQRASFAAQVRAAKQSMGEGDKPVYKPGREARVIRRLLERHDGEFPRESLVRVWRTIIDGMTHIQCPLKIACYAAPRHSAYQAFLRDHFGVNSFVSVGETTAQVYQAVASGSYDLGVLPMAKNGETLPWWAFMRQADEPPYIVARIPFLIPYPSFLEDMGGSRDALVIGTMPPEPSGNDKTALAVYLKERLSVTGAKQLLGNLGLYQEPNVLYSYEDRHFVEIDGFFQQNDPYFKHFTTQEPLIAGISVLGSYATQIHLPG